MGRDAVAAAIREENDNVASHGWTRRRGAGAAIRVGVTIAPTLLSAAMALLLNHVLADAASLTRSLLRSLVIMTVSLITVVIVDRAARRLLPLAALLQLTLVFPDHTPSRFRTALKAGSGRRLARQVERARNEGLSSDVGEAAEQLVVLASAIGDHDRRTRGHSERVRLFAELLGEELHLDAEERAKLQWAALIHDIGKIHVPAEILNKKGRPDPQEWAILQTHPLEGEALAAPVAEWLGEWFHAIGAHHERFDGTGYPRQLTGKNIPRAGAIVAVADSFEVMTAVRSYKKAMPLADARAELTRCAGTHFDRDVVRAFLKVSLGDTKRAMGVLGALAHLPVLGRFTTAAAYATDAVPVAAHAVSVAAATGAGTVALTGALMAAPSAGATDLPPHPVPNALQSSAPMPTTTSVSSSRRAPTVAPHTTTTAAPAHTATVAHTATAAQTTTVAHTTTPGTSSHPAMPSTVTTPSAPEVPKRSEQQPESKDSKDSKDSKPTVGDHNVGDNSNN